MASSAEPETKTVNPIREIAELGPLILDKALSKEEFALLSARYPDLRMEREKSGKITIMSPGKFGSGNRESIANLFLGLWWLKKRIGEIFSASTELSCLMAPSKALIVDGLARNASHWYPRRKEKMLF